MAEEHINEPSETSAPTARQLLIQWANKQDGWVRQLIFEVLASSQAPSDEALAQIYNDFLIEKSLADGTKETVAPLAQDESSADVSGGFTFLRLENLRGVNALTEGQVVDFNPGLTILFGENGTGKTGYALVLKTLAGVRTAETILPNVHKTGKVVPQEASITFAVASIDPLVRPISNIVLMSRTSFTSCSCARHIDEASLFSIAHAQLCDWLPLPLIWSRTRQSEVAQVPFRVASRRIRGGWPGHAAPTFPTD